MDLNKKTLSDIVVFNKYAKYIEEKGRRETFDEIVDRCKNMHVEHFKDKGEEFTKEISDVFDNFVKTKKVLPSMRSAQFAGKAIELNPTRQYNCSFLAIDNISAFNECMFLLLSGTGVGFSVQKHHVEKLPSIKRPTKTRRYLIGDNIESWSDAVKMLFKAFFKGSALPLFDYRDIREKGMPLITSGGKAPGAEPLRNCLHKIKMILERKKDGEQLSTLECHDIVCHIADAVLSGGIRRAACISLFSMDDEEMLNCKTGNWWELNPQRGRANNSVSILRHRVKKVDFMNLWERIKASKAGEPGFYFTNNADWGINPCKPLESLILTKDGYITFEQALEYNELDVVLPSGEIVKATKPFKTGTNRSITKVSLSNGKYIYGTPNHKHMTNDGIWKEISEFEIGDKLEYSVINIHGDFNTIINQENYNKGLIAGWSVADGWFWKNEKGSHTYGICFGINEFDCVPLYESLLNMKVKPHQDKPDTCKLFTTKKLEFIEKIKEIGLTTEKTKIEWLYKKDKDFKLGFIRSIFTADGSVRHSNNVELYSIDRKMLEVVSNVLNEFGIYNTICIHNNERHYIAKDGKIRNNKITYKINVFSGQFKKIGFLSSFKQTRLDAHILKTPRNTTYVEVLDIVHEYKVEDVYDITVEHDSHSFVDTGITSHNCCEISLRSNQMCNLTTVNTSNIKDQDDLNERVAAASFIGTLQAAYTDFYYLRDIWKRTCEKEALIGVSLTGIASNEYLKCDLSQASEIVKNTNIRVAKLIGINPASRTTCVKPEGTASLVLGTSSGVHSWFAPYYIRRMKVGKNEALYTYLNSNIPELLEDDFFNPNKDAFVTIPIAAPEGAITSDVETPLQLLERIKYLSDNWIKPGHVKGDNTHNVSATVYIKPEEWDNVGEWMWNHRDSYNGLSVLDFDGGTYKQTPFERITKERYEEMSSFIKDIDLTNVLEGENNVDLKSEVACSSGVCELQF